jgi:hypothetical protein
MAAPLLFYCTVLLISSAWSGTLPNLLVLLGSVLTLLAAAAVPTVLLAPRGNGGTRASTEPEDGAIAELRRRYASGAVSEEEFERRLGTLIEAPTEAGERSFAAGGPRETVRAPADAESEPE